MHALQIRQFAHDGAASRVESVGSWTDIADRRSAVAWQNDTTKGMDTTACIGAVMCCRRSSRSKDTGACIGTVMCCHRRANSGMRGWRAYLVEIVALNASEAAPVVGAFMPTSVMQPNAAAPTITRTCRIEEQRRSRSSLLPPRSLCLQQSHVLTIRIREQKSYVSHPLHANLVGLDIGTISAAGSIAISTAAGMWADKHIRFLHGAGTMITILFA